jgi:hypothetical protein
MGASFKAKFRTKISKISHLQDSLGVAMLRVLTYERPAGPGVGYLRIGTAATRKVTLRAERDAVYQAMEAGRLLEKVI